MVGVQPPSAAETLRRTPPLLGELEGVRQQILEHLLQTLGVGDDAAAEMRIEIDLEGELPVSASWRNGRATASSRLAKKISSASTVTVPDSIFERSRMSLMRLSRSVPAPWMVRANSTCLPVRLPSGLSASCWPRIRMLFSGVRSSCDMLARNSDLYFEVSASSAAFSSSARRACSISWFLRFDFDVTFGELLRLLLQLFVGLLQFALLCLQFASELLRLFEQAFRLHRGFDRVKHDADAGRQLLEERRLQRGELVDRSELDHRLDLVFEEHRQHDDVARHDLEQRRADRHGVGRASR